MKFREILTLEATQVDPIENDMQSQDPTVKAAAARVKTAQEQLLKAKENLNKAKANALKKQQTQLTQKTANTMQQ